MAITAGDKVIIEKAMIAAENDWDAYKEVMTMLVDLKGSEKSAVKADFEKYFELADEYTGRNGLLALEDLKDAQIIVLKGLGRFATGSQAYANQEKRLREIKEKAEVASKRLENMKAELLSVEKNIKARYQ